MNKFGIKWYFIGDWDNTIENNIVEPQEMSEYIHLAKAQYSMDQINKQKFYTRIISTIQKYYPDRYKYIISIIIVLILENVKQNFLDLEFLFNI